MVKPVLIAYWFKHDLLQQNRFKVEVLTSSDSIKKWNDGKIQIAAIHPASMRTWFESTSRWFNTRMVWTNLELGVISTNKCKAVQARTNRHSDYPSF